MTKNMVLSIVAIMLISVGLQASGNAGNAMKRGFSETTIALDVQNEDANVTEARLPEKE